MKAAARPRTRFVHGPGLGWLPAVWRRPATWRTVWRFAWLGPLVGGAPYVVFVLPIPFAYAIGLGPAVVAGLVFAGWYHAGGRTPSAPWRALVGALAGGAAVGATVLAGRLMGSDTVAGMASVVALHGVPAAVVLALMQKPAPPPA